MLNSRTALSRRTILGGLLAGSAFSPRELRGSLPTTNSLDTAEARVRASLKEAKGTQLVLLGTGAGPQPGMDRHMQSSVLLHNGAAYVIDCGMGVTDLFARTGIGFNKVRSIFITHQHPDHNIEYGPFLVIGWIHGLQQSVHAFGPPPLTQMTEDYLRSMKATIDFWVEDLKIQRLGMIPCMDLPQAGPVTQDDNVKVTSVWVQHLPVHSAYGYRLEFPDRSIVFSGDTVPLDTVAQFAQGADILVHEAMDVPATEQVVRQQAASWHGTTYGIMMHHMNEDHSPVVKVGQIAKEAGVKTLVLSHLTPPRHPPVPDDQWLHEASKYYKGRIVVGHDLMVV